MSFSRLVAAMSQPHLSPAAALVGADIASRLGGYDPQYREELVSWYEAATVPGAVPGAVPRFPPPPPPMAPPSPPPIPPEIPVAEHWRCRSATGFVAFVAQMAAEHGLDDAGRCRLMRREEARILPGHDQPELRRLIARYPAVAELARAWRALAAKLDGDDHRGMIPGGECKAAYDAAVQAGQEDPEPVWTNTPVFIGDDWG